MADVAALVMVRPSFCHMAVAVIFFLLSCFLFQAGKIGKEPHGTFPLFRFGCSLFQVCNDRKRAIRHLSFRIQAFSLSGK